MKKIYGVIVLCLCMVACGSETQLFQQAKLAQSQGNYQKALGLYNKLLKQNPNHAAALTNRALVWELMPAKDKAEKAKNLDFAEQDYLRALEINPERPETYNNLGGLYLDRNQNGYAVAYLSEALYRDPTYFKARVNRAVAYSKLGQFSDAIADFNIASQQRPHDPFLLLNRGLAYMDVYKYEAAAGDFSHALVKDPNNARLYVERARAFMKMGYPADAYDDLTQAIALQPSYAVAYYFLADLLFRNGEKDEALGTLVRTKELAPQYVAAYDLMGDMLAMEDPVAATANYLVALKLDPEHEVKYRWKIEMMKTEEGRYRVMTQRFFPQGRAYDVSGQPRFRAPVNRAAGATPANQGATR
ncbi:MAG: tetratricopeptide repeat protein [Elusimicrobiaceae bacterium]|nr:tetratricopeptide repeat protein [Elusimicrobiaceae bacterium]